jgi:CDP-diacylglycerol--glycerol-3-phosphate 3-phosphatidyltransferase
VIDLACSFALLAAVFVAMAAYAGRLARLGRAGHERVDRAGSSPLLGKGVLEMGYWAMRPLASACTTAGIGANAVSFASLGLAGAAGAAFAIGRFGAGALLSAASFVCDALDGSIARETGTASASGEVLDAAVDRYAELFVLGGIAFHERGDPATLLLVLAATAGAIMVSYATAKAEAMQVEAPRGLMRRQERAVYLALGATLVPLLETAGRWGMPIWAARAPLLVALALVAILGNASAICRLKVIAERLHRTSSLQEGAASKNVATDVHAAAGDAVR